MTLPEAEALYEGVYLTLVNSDYEKYLEKSAAFEPIRNIQPADEEGKASAYVAAAKAICESAPKEKLDVVLDFYPELNGILDPAYLEVDHVEEPEA